MLLRFLLSCQLLGVAFQELSLRLLIIIIFLVQLAIWNVCLAIYLKYIMYLLIVEDYAAVLSNDYTVMVDFD
jgi:type IV secretory pathway VirB3-like protein